jgi:predicted protein tyrosine phosphatase
MEAFMAWGFEFKSDEKMVDFFPEDEISLLKPPQGAVLIAIDNEYYTEPIESNRWGACLNLSFPDTEDKYQEGAFNESDAANIIKFMLSLTPAPSFIAVSCLMGRSRSAAVVKFITKYVYPECYNVKFDREYRAYNKLVFKTLEKMWKKHK